MKPLHQYKAIFFDVGDTLMTIPAARAVIHQYLADRSLHRDESHIGDLFTEAFRELYYGKEVGAFEECTPETDRAFWVMLYHYILEKLGVRDEWSEDEVHRCCHELYEMFTSPEHYELFDDVKECMPLFREKGLKLGIISNFAPTLRTILEYKGILHHFNPVIVSTEVGLEKPDPAIFTLALQTAGLDASEVLYVGDHERNDIWAPGQIGMDAVQIRRYDDFPGEGIRSLRELL
ncbi:HAD-IA family hydrolase [Paenibacillus thalictri]|uniref:HAD family hydrolase n=1 Tax=Paenibacillus thalictri TaxID=2527873 RepID=A0A4Q9DK95_9BACL|nr:HAD-IA family hydrolase [Paenibacillus thalictri]TBL71548.1 HAD family hydrolase [Paenibacillus thalictri]